MKQYKKITNVTQIKRCFIDLNLEGLNYGLDVQKIRNKKRKHSLILGKSVHITLSVIVICIFYECCYNRFAIQYAQGVRCIIPNNYFVWEATRPIPDCKFCINVTKPIVLPNVTKEEFKKYAYISKPVVIRKAFTHWPAIRHFDFYFFKKLYDSVQDSYKSVDEECQFLHFRSNFISLRDVFAMDGARIENKPGQKSWYVGWGNCHPVILEKMRQYYPKPHFLPDDCEIPSKEYVFMGYDDGATMHLDFINRLMWQAQLRGSKTWHLVPVPECEHLCQPLSFLVEPGDAVLVDTRIWYHGTTITPGEFSLSVQSEYG